MCTRPPGVYSADAAGVVRLPGQRGHGRTAAPLPGGLLLRHRARHGQGMARGLRRYGGISLIPERSHAIRGPGRADVLLGGRAFTITART
jgi:hypothetical protein